MTTRDSCHEKAAVSCTKHDLSALIKLYIHTINKHSRTATKKYPVLPKQTVFNATQPPDWRLGCAWVM